MVSPLSRREVLVAGAGAALACKTRGAEGQGTVSTTSKRMPVVFMGHGNPMNAIEDTPWSRAWAALGQKLPTPKAILAISAHWFVPGTWVMSNAVPETIHDFGGFPQRLFEVQYPAKGSSDLVKRVTSLLSSVPAGPKDDWGLDHGTWSVLKHVRPAADVPVVQLSINRTLSAAAHVTIAKQLAPLRDEGILILGSGNVTHNLRHAMTSDGVTTPPWASHFDSEVTKALEQRDTAALAALVTTEAGVLSHPWPDHFLPLVYAAAAASDTDRIEYPVTGWDFGSLSMRSVTFTS